MMLDKETNPVQSMVFRLDPRAGVPTYLQLVHQVAHAVRLGYLREGDQLPRVKDVVAALSINPNTVLKAYRDLEHKGLVSGRPGQGTFVQAVPEVVGSDAIVALKRQLIFGWLTDAGAAGLDEDATVALFWSALRDFRDGKTRAPKSARAGRERDHLGEVVA
jgi:GntR family transcriptional regulator